MCPFFFFKDLSFISCMDMLNHVCLCVCVCVFFQLLFCLYSTVLFIQNFVKLIFVYVTSQVILYILLCKQNQYLLFFHCVNPQQLEIFSILRSWSYAFYFLFFFFSILTHICIFLMCALVLYTLDSEYVVYQGDQVPPNVPPNVSLFKINFLYMHIKNTKVAHGRIGVCISSNLLWEETEENII